MSMQLLNLLIISLLFIAALRVMLVSTGRSAQDVAHDLRDESLDTAELEDFAERGGSEEEQSMPSNSLQNGKNILGYTFGDHLSRAGLIEPDQRRYYLIIHKLLPIAGAALFLLIPLFSSSPTFGGTLIVCSFGMATGLAFRRWLLKVKTERYFLSLVFYLPLVMERIAMAAQAGLDIVPAVQAAVSCDADGAKSNERDPVARLLAISLKLNQYGLSFERALKEVASVIDCSALRHAFLHLGVAQREGGVLIMPLRELSDATQSYYQESVENEIAELPVKATMPLICTFAGLLICFLTPPFLQVLAVLTSNSPVR